VSRAAWDHAPVVMSANRHPHRHAFSGIRLLQRHPLYDLVAHAHDRRGPRSRSSPSCGSASPARSGRRSPRQSGLCRPASAPCRLPRMAAGPTREPHLTHDRRLAAAASVIVRGPLAGPASGIKDRSSGRFKRGAPTDQGSDVRHGAGRCAGKQVAAYYVDVALLGGVADHISAISRCQHDRIEPLVQWAVPRPLGLDVRERRFRPTAIPSSIAHGLALDPR
jgi:hypothetical protein